MNQCRRCKSLASSAQGIAHNMKVEMRKVQWNHGATDKLDALKARRDEVLGWLKDHKDQEHVVAA